MSSLRRLQRNQTADTRKSQKTWVRQSWKIARLKTYPRAYMRWMLDNDTSQGRATRACESKGYFNTDNSNGENR